MECMADRGILYYLCNFYVMDNSKPVLILKVYLKLGKRISFYHKIWKKQLPANIYEKQY